MAVEFCTGKKRRFIPIHKVAQKLSEEASEVLPAFHSLKGCDSNSAPFGCGKKAAFASLKKNIDRFRGLLELGNSAVSSDISEELLDTAIEFLYSLYDTKGGITDEINVLRYKLSVKKGLEKLKIATYKRLRNSSRAQGKLPMPYMEVRSTTHS